MRNKKGDLVKNTLSIVIAVIGLTIFIFGVSRLYEANKNNERAQMKKVLDNILEKAEALKEGESVTFPLQGFSKEGGKYLVGWGSDSEDYLKPEKCFLESCLCVCPEAFPESCQKKGICTSLGNKNVNVFSNYNRVVFEGAFDDVEYQEAIISCIKLNSPLVDVKISFAGNEFSISAENPINKEFEAIASINAICRQKVSAVKTITS